VPYVISDADLQATYRRFIQLEKAIEARDIGAVTRLTRTNGALLQSLLQLFSNSDSIDARIQNVSTRNSSGTIVGTLIINKVVKRGGGTADTPANLRSLKLTSRRDASGWSIINW